MRKREHPLPWHKHPGHQPPELSTLLQTVTCIASAATERFRTARIKPIKFRTAPGGGRRPLLGNRHAAHGPGALMRSGCLQPGSAWYVHAVLGRRGCTGGIFAGRLEWHRGRRPIACGALHPHAGFDYSDAVRASKEEQLLFQGGQSLSGVCAACLLATRAMHCGAGVLGGRATPPPPPLFSSWALQMCRDSRAAFKRTTTP